jgi:hypothetical protein
MQKMEQHRTMHMEKLSGCDIPNRLEQMKAVQKEALELFQRKNEDYGDAFAKYGTTGVIMRMEDKLQRFMSITQTGICLVNTESLRDTLIDLHNYAAMAIMLLDEKQT